jgi:hypothetical protein
MTTPEAKAPTGAEDVTASGGDAKVKEPAAALLDIANEATGRKFSNVNQIKEYFENYNSRIGDQKIAEATKKAQQYDNILAEWANSNQKSTEYADAFFQDYFMSKSKGEPVPSSDGGDPMLKRELNTLREGYSKLETEIQRNALISKYPEAMDYLDEIAALAKARGQSYLEAFEKSSVKKVIEAQKAQAQLEKKGDGLIEPGNRRGIEPQKIEGYRQRFNDKKNPVFDSDRENLVKEYLGMTS